MLLPGQGGDLEGPGLSVRRGAAPITASCVTQGKSHNLSELSFLHLNMQIKGAPHEAVMKV